jgi:hypothetical protein
MTALHSRFAEFSSFYSACGKRSQQLLKTFAMAVAAHIHPALYRSAVLQVHLL